MYSKEKILREERTNMAIRNNLIGPSGKLGVIAKYLGSPIIRQGSGLLDVNYLEDIYSREEPEGIQSFDANEEYVVCEGWVFDGLSRGMHLEIKYIDHQKKLTVSYKGYEVYSEVAGDLLAYAPFPDWENMISRLYDQARNLQKAKKERDNQEAAVKSHAKRMDFLTKMRMKWGI